MNSNQIHGQNKTLDHNPWMKLNSSQNIMNVYPTVSFINNENFHLFGSFFIHQN